MIKIAYDHCYQLPLPEGHRFPMSKYELIPKQLMHHGLITENNLFKPEPCAYDVVLETHDKSYVDALLQLSLDASHIRRIGFPLTSALIEREFVIAQGTIDCALHAMQDGVSMNVAGGTHHAFSNRGEGFCLLNDMAIAANYLLNRKLAHRILIVDLDVHQGNGTAALFEKNESVFTLSMHGKNNYPFFKERSSLDIELVDGINGSDYLNLLRQHLPETIHHFTPDFIFYLCGVDVLETDKYGKLKLTPQECRLRDRFVFEQCKQHQIPVVAAMGGGYSPRVADIVDAHCATFEEAIRTFFE